MADLHTVLMIPVNPDQPMEMSQSELPVDVKAMLEQRGGIGRYVLFRIAADTEGDFMGSAAFLVGPSDVNARAMDILAALTGVYLEPTGAVALLDLPSEKIIQVLREFK